MQFLIFMVFLSWIISAMLEVAYVKKERLQNLWIYRYVKRRFWYFCGVNALVRILYMEFLMVLIAGFLAYDKEFRLLAAGKVPHETLDFEVFYFLVCTLIPITLTAGLPFVSKDILREERVEINIDTLYYKSNLSKWTGKVYPLLQLLQRFSLVLLLFVIEDVIIQLCCLLLGNLIFSLAYFGIP